jgi:exosome complex RNA-binding protein Csl4
MILLPQPRCHHRHHHARLLYFSFNHRMSKIQVYTWCGQYGVIDAEGSDCGQNLKLESRSVLWATEMRKQADRSGQ